jgi:hypothetical protein
MALTDLLFPRRILAKKKLNQLQSSPIPKLGWINFFRSHFIHPMENGPNARNCLKCIPSIPLSNPFDFFLGFPKATKPKASFCPWICDKHRKIWRGYWDELEMNWQSQMWVLNGKRARKRHIRIFCI